MSQFKKPTGFFDLEKKKGVWVYQEAPVIQRDSNEASEPSMGARVDSQGHKDSSGGQRRF